MELDELTSYAWVYRYPTQMEPPEKGEAERALGLARRAMEKVLEALPFDVTRLPGEAPGQ
jgi:hypothetical protein